KIRLAKTLMQQHVKYLWNMYHSFKCDLSKDRSKWYDFIEKWEKEISTVFTQITVEQLISLYNPVDQKVIKDDSVFQKILEKVLTTTQPCCDQIVVDPIDNETIKDDPTLGNVETATQQYCN